MGECIADTIYLTREIPIEKIVVSKPAISKKIKDWLIIGIIFIFGLFFIRKLIK